MAAADKGANKPRDSRRIRGRKSKYPARQRGRERRFDAGTQAGRTVRGDRSLACERWQNNEAATHHFGSY